MYTIENTGGSHTGYFLQEAMDAPWIGDEYLMARGQKCFLDDTNASSTWLRDSVLAHCENRFNSDSLFLLSAHHYEPNSNLMRTIKDIPIPIVVTIRDPLLVIHTWLWRDAFYKKIDIAQLDTSYCLNKTIKLCALLCDFLSINLPNVYKLCIEQVSYSSLSNLMKHVGLSVNDSVIHKYSRDRGIGDTSVNLEIRDRFLEMKKIIMSNDRRAIQELFPEVYNYLSSSDHLRDLYRQHGYTDLFW
jgi:hypothetical protein